MTFKDVAVKDLKYHLNKYFTYILCSVLAVMSIFMYSTVLYNKHIMEDFNKASVQNIMWLCFYILVIFSIVFISYANIAFIKSRSKDLGLYMILGMSKKDILRLVRIENGLIIAIALVFGLFFGTVFSKLFFIIIMALLELEGIVFYIGLNNFIVTISVMLGVFLIVTFRSKMKIRRMEIITLLKEARIEEKNKFRHVVWGIVGIILVILNYSFIKIAIQGMWQDGKHWILNYIESPTLLLVCVAMCIVGIYLLIAQLGQLLFRLSKKFKRFYYKKMINLTEIKHKFNQYKKVFFMVTLSSMLSIYAIGMVYSIIRIQEGNQNRTFAYDMMTIQTVNQAMLTEGDFQQAAEESGYILTDTMTLEFIEMSLEKNGRLWPEKIVVFSNEILSGSQKSSIAVQKGMAISSLFFDGKKWYQEGEKITLIDKSSNKRYEYDFEYEVVENFYIGYSQSLGRSIILDHEDYTQLLDEIGGEHLKMFTFLKFEGWRAGDWYKANKMTENVTTLWQQNNAGLQQSKQSDNQIEAVSKQGQFKEGRIEFKFYFFAMAFVGLLFFILSGGVLFFKIQGDLDHYYKRSGQLSRIGIIQKEMKKEYSRELKLIFFTPAVLGSVFGYIYLAMTTRAFFDNSYVLQKVLIYSCTVILIYLFLQTLFYKLTQLTLLRRVNEKLS